MSAIQGLTDTTLYVSAMQQLESTSGPNDPDFNGTAFVPSDLAWQNLLTSLGWTWDQLLAYQNGAALQETLLYSIVPGEILTQKAMANDTYLTQVNTLQGQPLMIDSEPGTIRIISTSRQPSTVWFNATLTSCDNQSVAYVVDQVPLPDPTWTDSA